MKISIAICTWNRARLLDQTLESISRMEVPPNLDWELIVVDNNSTEPAVPLILNGWRDQLPMVTTIEKEQGHSAARNCAVELAKGDYIIWTDNDVKVNQHWLASYADAFRKNPDVVYFGGMIEPLFEKERPGWIDETWNICAPVYAARDLGNEEIKLNEKSLPYGANFAINSDVQRRFLYDTKWGRKQNAMLGEDEVAVLRAIAAEGYEGMWVPGADLQHVIPSDRATPQYVASYYFGQGYANVLKNKVSRSRSAIRWDAFRCWWGYYWGKLFSQPQVWVSRMVHASICKGELAAMKDVKAISAGK